MSGSRTIAAMDDRLGAPRPGSRRGHRRRAVAPARAAAHLARAPARCSARCSSGRSRSSHDEAAPGPGLVRRPDRVAHPAVGRGGRLPRRHPARAVRAVARPGARRSPGSSSSGRSRSRLASTTAVGALTADDRTALLVTILLVAFLGVHRRRRDGAGRSRPDRAARSARANLLVLAAGDALVAGPARLPGGGAAGHRACATRSGRR